MLILNVIENYYSSFINLAREQRRGMQVIEKVKEFYHAPFVLL